MGRRTPVRGCHTGRVDSRIVYSTSLMRTSLRIVLVVVDIGNSAKKIAFAPARGRIKSVVQPNIEWMDKIDN